MMSNFKTYLLSAACLSLAACGGGSSGSSGGGGTNTDLTAPTVSFSPNTLSVQGGATGSSTLSASDNVGVTSNTVSCTNGGSFTNNTFTAPDVAVDTTSVCTATARDAAGNSSTATLTVSITPAPDTIAPTVTISPDTFTLFSLGETVISWTITDNRAGYTINPVTCDNGGTYDNGTFTAPAVTVETVTVCTLSATDQAGNVGSDTFTVTVQPDTEAPVVSFNPTTLTLNSGETAGLAVTATDNDRIVSGPDVTCTDGNHTGDQFTAPVTQTDTTITCTATATDPAGLQGTANITINVVGVTTPTSVTVSGKITFDHVPFNTTTNGLNYNGITQKPARGVTVEAVTSAGAALSPAVTGVTDANGDYSLQLPLNTDVRIRARAEMVSTTGTMWDVKVVDNTSSDALYTMQGSVFNTGTANVGRSLNAASGWGTTSYTGTRVAGPFAILNPIYDALQKVAAADTTANLPAMTFNWSPNNTTASGNLTTGAIGTSFYSNGKVYILGDDDNDTDEYDDHVVVHEWGHYFEDKMSRSDSIGGAHSGGDKLDPRVAFGEGFGNALSGMILDDPFYRDSRGSQQSQGFAINVESNSTINEGWFNESSVQSILYDIYDSAADGSDNISAGFGPIYNVLVSDAYKNTPYFTTIFHFASEYKTANTGDVAGVDALLTAQTINGTGATGTGETNSGGVSNALPLYKTITVGTPLNICSLDDSGTYNKLGVRNFLVFAPTTTASYTLTMTRAAGVTASLDPDFVIYNKGSQVASAGSGVANSETITRTLQSGETYLIDASEYNNVQGTNGDYCFDFTISN